MHKTLIILAALAAMGASANADPPKQNTRCFFVNQTWNWKAGPDQQTIYIKVFPSRYYRLDLAAKCPGLNWPDARLITVHRSNSICDGLDWDLKVSQGIGGPPIPCIVKKMTELTPAEVEQIPPKSKPH